MWQIDPRGGTLCPDASSDLRVRVDAFGGTDPITMSAGGLSIEVHPVQTAVLPSLDEHFVRDDQWHANLPQSTTRFGIRLAFDQIPLNDHVVALECRLSVQTDLLDSHPELDLRLCGGTPTMVSPDDDVPPVATVIGSNDFFAAVLLSSNDAPHTKLLSTDPPSLRLFGDFLEKGVIRRARPWIIFGRFTGDDLKTWQQQLSDSPVPLTA